MDHITFRRVGRQLGYEVVYTRWKRMHLKMCAVFAGVLTLICGAMGMQKPWAGLLMWTASTVLFVLIAVFGDDPPRKIADQLHWLLVEELERAEAEGRVREEVRREHRAKVRVAGEDEVAPDEGVEDEAVDSVRARREP